MGLPPGRPTLRGIARNKSVAPLMYRSAARYERFSRAWEIARAGLASQPAQLPRPKNKMAFPVLTEERQVYPHDTARVAAHGEFVNRASQPDTASTYLFHDGFRPDGRALQLDRRLPQRASEAWRSLQKSDRAIAADLNIGHQTVGRARKELTGPYGPVVERTGLDGKTR